MLKCYMGVLIHIKTQMIAFHNDLKLFHINTKKVPNRIDRANKITKHL